MRKHLFLICSLAFLCLTLGTLSAEEKTYKILFIQSYTNNTPWHNELIAGLQEGLKQEGVKADIVTEYLNADFWAFASECVIMRRICERARLRKTDLIVTSGDEAFFTLTHCGDSLPYRLPVVVSGIKYPDEKVFEKMPNVSGFTSKTDFTILLEEAIRIFPGRKEIVCLSDSSFLSLKGVRAVEEAWIPFKEKHPEYSLRKLNVQAKSINSIITSICYDYNAYKYIVIAPKWIPFLSLKLKAPTFANQNLAMTNGVLCVYDVEPATDTYAAGRQAASILKGDSSVSYGVKNLDGKLLFDYKQLGFFHVDVESVEEQGSILNIPLMDRYKVWFILFYSVTVGALVVLVVWLYRSNRHELRKRIQAQTRLMIQQRLVEQRDEFDKMFCSIRDGLITYDTEMHIHFVNRALAEMLGLSSDTYMARSYEGQVAGSIFHIYMNGENILPTLLEQVVRDKKPVVIPEKAFMQENVKGTYFPVSGEVVPIFAKDKLTGMAIVCRNISENEMQRRFFGMAIEESSIYPWQYNTRLKCFHFPVGLLKRFNYSDHTGYISREELDRVIHPEDLLRIRKHFDSIILGREPNSRMSFRLQNTAGGYEWWEFRFSAMPAVDNAEGGKDVSGILININDMKKREKELILMRGYEQKFLANMSHEIRTPLNSIVGFSNLLASEKDLDEADKQLFAKTINQSCDLLLVLINDILEVSRLQSGQMKFEKESCSVKELVDDLYLAHQLLVPTHLRFSKEAEGDLFIYTDKKRLSQVITNFLTNACKFTNSGYIKLGFKHLRGTDEVAIFVEDSGIGLSEEQQEKVFSRFFKQDEFSQGAGLGLSICQGIVQNLGGRIELSSKLGKGSRFSVVLPVYKGG